ncbi:MAG TPA: PIN domain nuclease [Patescibacteria group bacterium]|nr:PIN domain nuclease [Patescibacteria group bacterium]
MIVVDSSVWIDHFNGRPTREVGALSRLSEAMLLVGDLIMVEVLQGFASENAFREVQQVFAAFEFRAMGGHAIAVAAARNHRRLRSLGVTPRSTIDTVIATFCIAGGHELLHSDRDFDPFERHLGLRVIKA